MITARFPRYHCVRSLFSIFFSYRQNCHFSHRRSSRARILAQWSTESEPLLLLSSVAKQRLPRLRHGGANAARAAHLREHFIEPL